MCNPADGLRFEDSPVRPGDTEDTADFVEFIMVRQRVKLPWSTRPWLPQPPLLSPVQRFQANLPILPVMLKHSLDFLSAFIAHEEADFWRQIQPRNSVRRPIPPRVFVRAACETADFMDPSSLAHKEQINGSWYAFESECLHVCPGGACKRRWDHERMDFERFDFFVSR